MKGRIPLHTEARPASGATCPTASLCLLAIPAALLDTSPTSVGFALTASALLGISLFRRRKPKTEEAPEENEDGQAPLETPEIARNPGADGSLLDLLSRAAYPIHSRSQIVKILGGEEVQLRLPDSSIRLPAGEVADRCFSKASSFSSPSSVLGALSQASWATTVMYYLSKAAFPIRSEEELPRALKSGYMDGVRISKLTNALEYPIPNASELLSQLSKARREGWKDEVVAGDESPVGEKAGGAEDTADDAAESAEEAQGSSGPAGATPSNPDTAQEAVA